MKGFWKRRTKKMNNDGITLVEILVTIVVIAIVAVPFLNSFAQGMKINNKARYTQDATETAQSVAEVFRTMTMEEIVKKYFGSIASGVYTEGIYNEDEDSYEASFIYGDQTDASGNKYVKGQAGEDFYIETYIKADPSTEEAYKFYANKNSTPIMNDISADNTIMVYDKYKANDSGVTENKYAVVHIDCNYDDTSKKYAVSVNVDTYNGTKNDANKVGSTIFAKQKIVGEDEALPLIYIIPTLVDRSGEYSDDKIEIKYNYTGDAAKEKAIQVFLMQQITTRTDAIGNIKLKDENIVYTIKNVTEDDTHSIPVGTHLIMYSNIDGFGSHHLPASGSNKSAVDDRNTFNALTDNGELVNNIYQLEIKVREGSSTGKAVATLTTTLTK